MLRLWGRKPSQDWRVPTRLFSAAPPPAPAWMRQARTGPGVPGRVAVPDGQGGTGRPRRTCPGEPPPGTCVCQLHPILSALPSLLFSAVWCLVPPPPPCYDLIFFSFGQISCFCCDLSWCCFSFFFFLPFPHPVIVITLSPAPAPSQRAGTSLFIIAAWISAPLT